MRLKNIKIGGNKLCIVFSDYKLLQDVEQFKKMKN